MSTPFFKMRIAGELRLWIAEKAAFRLCLLHDSPAVSVNSGFKTAMPSE